MSRVPVDRALLDPARWTTDHPLRLPVPSPSTLAFDVRPAETIALTSFLIETSAYRRRSWTRAVRKLRHFLLHPPRNPLRCRALFRQYTQPFMGDPLALTTILVQVMTTLQ